MKHLSTISIAKESESGLQKLRLQAHWSDAKTNRAILFLHGYKGYAEWGCWGLLCDAMTRFGVHAFRLDFSGNGTSFDRPDDIHDLEAWSENTYRNEVQDAIAAIRDLRHRGLDVILMGHSRGGGIATIVASTLRNTAYAIKGVILLASVADFERRFPSGEAFASWQASDRWEVLNGRTGETYHHKFSFYSDFVQHHELLDIRQQASRVDVPVLIAHATDDSAVSVAEAEELARIFARRVPLQEAYFEKGGHTFGSKEPWPAGEPLPKEMADLLPEIGHFVQSIA